MPYVADTPVMLGEAFLTAPDVHVSVNLSIDSFSTQLYVLLSGLGGYRAGQSSLSVGLMILDPATWQPVASSAVTFRRWQDHSLIVPDVAITPFVGAFQARDYILRLDPNFADSDDYCWLGPVIVSYRKMIP